MTWSSCRTRLSAKSQTYASVPTGIPRISIPTAAPPSAPGMPAGKRPDGMPPAGEYTAHLRAWLVRPRLRSILPTRSR